MTMPTPAQSAISLLTSACHDQDYGLNAANILNIAFDPRTTTDEQGAEAAMRYIALVLTRLAAMSANLAGQLSTVSGASVDEILLALVARDPDMQPPAEK